MSARSVFTAKAGDFSAGLFAQQTLESALKYTALAPTESGLKTWRFRLTNTYIELRTKDNPEQEKVDPERRELIIGCGSALLYLTLALKHVGCLGKVTIFPDIGEPELVARIHFGFCWGTSALEKLIFEAMAGSREIVTPSDKTPISESMLASLGEAAAGERSWLDVVRNEMSCNQILSATRMDGQQAPKGRSRAGLTFVFGSGSSSSPVGAVAQIPQPAASKMTLAVVKTKTDDKHGWLQAGQTVARTVLQAQKLGLVWTFINPMRHRETREALRTGVGHKGFVQVILRLGGRNALQWNPAFEAHRLPTQPQMGLR